MDFEEDKKQMIAKLRAQIINIEQIIKKMEQAETPMQMVVTLNETLQKHRDK